MVLYQSEDGAPRRHAEDRLVGQLRAKGVESVPAYAVLAGADVEDLHAARSKLRDWGYDGMIVMRVVPRDPAHDPPGPSEWAADWTGDWVGRGYKSPNYWVGDEVPDRGWHAWPNYGHVGHVDTNNSPRVETNAYSLADNQLVWSRLTKSEDAGESPDELVDRVTTVVAGELSRRGIVASRPPRPIPTARR